MSKKGNKKKQQAGKLEGNWVLWGTLILVALIVVAIFILNKNAKTGQALGATQTTSLQQTGQTQPTLEEDTREATPEGGTSLAEVYSLYPDLATFLDVRTKTEFGQYHILYSVSIPLAELVSRTGELPQGRSIVIVCLVSDDCITARDILVSAGFKRLFPMTDGIENWVLGGYPFEGTFPY